MNSKVKRKINIISALLGEESPCSVRDHEYYPETCIAIFKHRKFMIDKETGGIEASVNGGNITNTIQIIEAIEDGNPLGALDLLRSQPQKTHLKQVRVEVICDLDVYEVNGERVKVDNITNITVTQEAIDNIE